MIKVLVTDTMRAEIGSKVLECWCVQDRLLDPAASPAETQADLLPQIRALELDVTGGDLNRVQARLLSIAVTVLHGIASIAAIQAATQGDSPCPAGAVPEPDSSASPKA